MAGMELSITDAAQILGISPNTVRRRLTNGLLTGNKVSGKWFITVEEPELPRAAPQHVETTESTALVQHLEALIAAQDAELSVKTEEINKLRGLIAERALKVMHAASERRWWQIWRRVKPGRGVKHLAYRLPPS